MKMGEESVTRAVASAAEAVKGRDERAARKAARRALDSLPRSGWKDYKGSYRSPFENGTRLSYSSRFSVLTMGSTLLWWLFLHFLLLSDIFLDIGILHDNRILYFQINCRQLT